MILEKKVLGVESSTKGDGVEVMGYWQGSSRFLP
jgi:hypothetical protein